MKINLKNGMMVEILPGQFPTLVSQDKKINGKLMANKAIGTPKRSPESTSEIFFKTKEERSTLKQMRKSVAPFQNKVLLKA